MTNKHGWTEDIPSEIAFPGANKMYQKRMFTYGNEETRDIYAELVEYAAITFPNGTTMPRTWELQMQVPDDFNVTGKTINVKVFTYDAPDFEQAEKDAKEIIKRLRKP